MIKLLACDIDGTLLHTDEREPHPRIIELLNSLMKKGVKLAIASGRSSGDIRRLFSGLDRKPCIIADDGALALGEGKILYSRPLLPGDISILLRKYKNNGVPVIFSAANNRYLLENGADRDALVKFEFEGNIHRISEFSELSEPVYKISFLWGSELPEHPPVPQSSRIYYRKDGWLEYIPRLADKGVALSALQSLYFADSFDTLVIGNETNDIGMAKKARYSVCIGNSCPQLSAVCSLTAENAIPILERIEANPSSFKI